MQDCRADGILNARLSLPLPLTPSPLLLNFHLVILAHITYLPIKTLFIFKYEIKIKLALSWFSIQNNFFFLCFKCAQIVLYLESKLNSFDLQ